MNLTKDQVNLILKNAPMGSDKTKILDGLVMKGYDLEGVDNERRRQELQTQQQAQTQQQQEKPKYMERLKTSFMKEGDDVVESFKRGQEIADEGQPTKEEVFSNPFKAIRKQVISSSKGMARTVLGGVGGVARIAWSPITEALAPIFAPLAEKASSNEQLQKVMKDVDSWAQQNPDAAANLKNIVDIGSSLTGVKGGSLFMRPVKKTIVKQGQTALRQGRAAVQGVEDTAKKALGQVVKTGEKKIAQTIAPKLTSKEIKLALKQDRVVRSGTLAKVFGKGDEVKLSRRVNEAAETINRRIPNADKMKDQDILNFAKKEIADISRTIQPELKKVKLGEELKDNILNSYAKIKQAQIDDASFNSAGIIKKQHEKFNKALSDIIDADNADDLWKIIKDYDASIKSNIKEANQFSSDAAQELKDIWLENRRILRDALSDVTDNIDDIKLQREFKDMSNFYLAQQNIINAAKFTASDKTVLRQMLLKVGLPFAVVGGGFKLID